MNRILLFLQYLSNIKWQIYLFCTRLSNPILRGSLIANKSIKNTHKGERCVIVGNGPSLKSQEMSLLKSVFTFTVNNIFKNQSLYDSVDTDCHVEIDPSFLNMPDTDFAQMLSALASNEKRRLFLTSSANLKRKSMIESHNMMPVFLYMHKYLVDMKWPNLSFSAYSVHNVVLAAIQCAMYMGFSEIILVGCDMTSFYENLEYNANGKCIDNHIHEIDFKYYELIRKEKDNSYMLSEYGQTLNEFKKLAEIAHANGVKILNATNGGILDMLPRIEYNSLFED